MYGKDIEHSTSLSAVQPLPRLGTASTRSVEKEYRSGANYRGQLQGNKRAGKGIFTWPNGAIYDGEFVDNLRHGTGKNCHTLKQVAAIHEGYLLEINTFGDNHT